MNYHVVTQVEGIVEDVDDSGVTMLVPEEVEADERQFGGYGGYGEEVSVDFVVNDSHSPYLPSRLFFHFLIITKGLCLRLI